MTCFFRFLLWSARFFHTTNCQRGPMRGAVMSMCAPVPSRVYLCLSVWLRLRLATRNDNLSLTTCWFVVRISRNMQGIIPFTCTSLSVTDSIAKCWPRVVLLRIVSSMNVWIVQPCAQFLYTHVLFPNTGWMRKCNWSKVYVCVCYHITLLSTPGMNLCVVCIYLHIRSIVWKWNYTISLVLHTHTHYYFFPMTSVLDEKLYIR